MIQSKAKLTIDFGNSETRVRISVNQGDGKSIKRKMVLSNRFAPVEAGYTPSGDYSTDTSTIMILDDDPDRGIVGGSRIVNGELAAKEFYDALGKPTAMDKKYTNQYTKYSLQLVVLHAYRAVMQILRATSLDNLDITWDVVVLLPPGDLDEGTPVLQQMIKGVGSFSYAYPAVKLPFKVDKVGVFAEGYCSYVGACFEDDFSIRKGYEDVVEDVTMVIDIGAGTSDMIIVEGGKPIRKTRCSITSGGNQVTSRVRLKAKSRLNARVSELAIEEAMQTGFLKSGSTKVDISDIIREEKENFARNIVAEVQDFFELTEFPAVTIGKVLVCGGGAIDSDMPGASERTGSMAAGIVTFMKKLSPNFQLVPLPVIEMVTCNPDGTPEKVVGTASPRDLNLIGGSILAEL